MSRGLRTAHASNRHGSPSEREQRVHVFPGALDTLSRWRRSGIPLALLTNGSSEFQRRKIDRFSLEPYFDAIFVEGELGFGKPDSRVFRAALAALGSDPAESWMVGDSLEADIRPALEIGLTTVWVDHAERGLPDGAPQPTQRVVSISEIREIESAG